MAQFNLSESESCGDPDETISSTIFNLGYALAGASRRSVAGRPAARGAVEGVVVV